MIQTIITSPFKDQNPGTSGLRKKVKVFEIPHYAENFIQSIFSCAGSVTNKLLVVGGDGRFLNRKVIQKVLKMALANGFGRIIVGHKGILSTPAASHLIRKHHAHGGIILSASHNPGGRDGDFGIKYNISNGGPAPEQITQKIYEYSKQITQYHIAKVEDIDLDSIGIKKIGSVQVEIIDPVRDYASLMEELFDFEVIRQAVARGFRFCFDAMHAVTGPYACEIFEKRLGFPKGTVKNYRPLPDFSARHPDPNPVHAQELYNLLMHEKAPDFGAASDGDGDRNLVLGKGIYISPSDSLAILVDNASLIRGYKGRVMGIARSMPTSRAVDCVAERRKIPLYETPTGWKFFNTLLDAGRITFCGEESFGTGSNHIREKDGIWAVLMWLNILAVSGKSARDIVRQHWQIYGRNYYSRHDYENVEIEAAEEMMEYLRRKIETFSGLSICGVKIERAEDFFYQDPIDHSTIRQQGICFFLQGEGRIIFRLSGTGTRGATVRIYLERFEENPDLLDLEPSQALQSYVDVVNELSDLKKRLGYCKPTMIV